MTTKNRSLFPTSLLIAVILPVVALAQPAGGARGGAATAPRTDAMSPRPAAMAGLLTVGQQKALDAIGTETAAQNTAATAAKQALVTASLTLPANPADIQAKATALANAEIALATARAEKYAALQAGADQIPASLRTPAVARLSGGGGRGGLAAPRSADDNNGFHPIFDGKTLAGWDGDPRYWRAEGGSIVGESTPENPVSLNTFLIWRGGIVKDFEFKTEFRMSGTNSGVQFRSHEVPTAGKWVLGGYQADMDFANQYTGGMGEERGRFNVMVPRGQMIRVTEDNAFKYLGTLGDPAEIGGSFLPNGWNTYHIIARGPTLIQILNGRVSMIMIDENVQARAMEGVLGLQMHTGNPFKVEYRNLLYREL